MTSPPILAWQCGGRSFLAVAQPPPLRSHVGRVPTDRRSNARTGRRPCRWDMHSPQSLDCMHTIAGCQRGVRRSPNASGANRRLPDVVPTMVTAQESTLPSGTGPVERRTTRVGSMTTGPCASTLGRRWRDGHVQRPLRHVAGRHRDGRQGRHAEGRHRQVVEADHGHVVGHPDAQLVSSVQDTKGQLVRRCDDRRRRLRGRRPGTAIAWSPLARSFTTSNT